MDTNFLPPLVGADDLVEFGGGPYTEAQVGAAANAIRRRAGWHIAPNITETVTLDHDGSVVVRLPSLHVTDVLLVEDMSGREPREITDYRWSSSGMLEGRFPQGFRSLRVKFSHGYSICPGDLARLVASRTQRRRMQESVGGVSVTYGVEGDRAVEESLQSYILGPRA